MTLLLTSPIPVLMLIFNWRLLILTAGMFHGLNTRVKSLQSAFVPHILAFIVLVDEFTFEENTCNKIYQ